MTSITPPTTDTGKVPRRIPAYLCGKCGAVAVVEYKAGYTQADLDRLPRVNDELTTQYRAAGAPFFPDFARAFDIREGITYGEHLRCACARCGYIWREPTLDRALAAAESAPIFDALAASPPTTGEGK